MTTVNASFPFDLSCLLVGGSKLYGLDTKNSDTDYRGIYLLKEPEKVMGLPIYGNRGYESIVTVSDDIDISFHEYRHFLHLLSKTNTSSIEVLFAPDDAFESITPEVQALRYNKFSLIDSTKLFKSICGYIHNEIRLTLGERTGKLGGKRKQALTDYGYSYKNLVQVLRLTFCAKVLFTTGVFPVRIKDFDFDLYTNLINIKLNPSLFSLDEVNDLLNPCVDDVIYAYENRTITYEFDYKLANDLILKAYSGILSTI